MSIFVSINHAIIMSNRKHGRSDPPFEIRTSKDDKAPQTLSNASYTGTVKLVYDPQNPLSSGQVVWFEIDEA